MMTSPISFQDIEQLSAYLDGQLPIREKMLLELRLRDNPELQTELEALAHTHLMLRSLPKRRAPRNFTLTPAMVQQRAPLRLFPAFRLASTLAAVLLVITFASDLLLGGIGARNAVSMAPAAKELVVQPERLAAPTQAAAAPTQAAPIIVWGTPINNANVPPGKGGSGGGSMPKAQIQASTPQPTEVLGIGGGPAATAVENSTQPALDLTTPVIPTPTVEMDAAVRPSATATPTITPAESQPSSNVVDTTTPTPTNTATPTTTPQPTETLAPLAVADAGTGPILGVQLTQPARKLASEPPTATPEPEPSPLTPLHAVEIILGAAVIIGGLAAFFFYRKESL
jgi:hypothetical protein